MNTISKIVAASALAFAFAAPVPSFAQGAFSDSIYVSGHNMSAKAMIGAPVYNDKHDKIGTIETILVKPSAAEPVVVMSVGDYLGKGQKLIAVPLSHLKVEGKTSMMMAGATKQMLESIPGYIMTAGG